MSFFLNKTVTYNFYILGLKHMLRMLLIEFGNVVR